MVQNHRKAFCCWSGGKDSCMALFRALNEKFNVVYLLNMISEDGKHSRSHGISSDLLKLQSESIGIPIVQSNASWENYENEFKNTVLELKKVGVTTGIFGDIDLQEHRNWVERVCKDIEIKPILPLWKEERGRLIKEFIQSGFKAIVVSTNAVFLGDEWLGKRINDEFIADLKSLGNIDLCGEKGEYHTFVYDGPFFKEPVQFIIGDKTLKDKYWVLEIKLKKNGI